MLPVMRFAAGAEVRKAGQRIGATRFATGMLPSKRCVRCRDHSDHRASCIDLTSDREQHPRQLLEPEPVIFLRVVEMHLRIATERVVRRIRHVCEMIGVRRALAELDALEHHHGR